MRQVLHLITRPDDTLSAEIISAQRKDATHQIDVVDLNKGKPDYEALLEKIFKADSIQSW